MTTTRCKLFTDTVLNNLLDAQKNMASAEKVDKPRRHENDELAVEHGGSFPGLPSGLDAAA